MGHDHVHPIDGTDHTTAEVDTKKVLRPDGAGGAAFDAEYGKSIYSFAVAGSFAGNQTGYWAHWGAYAGNGSAETRFPAGMITRFTMNVTTSNLNSASTFEVWKNNAATGVSLAYAATETGRKTVTATLAVADGDLICVKAILGGTGGQTIAPKEMAVEFEGET